MDEKAHRKFEIELLKLVKEFPFLLDLSNAIHKFQNPSLPATAGIGVDKNKRICLFYNPTNILDLTEGELSFVILHEFMHFILDHLTSRNNKDWNKQRANIAMDLAINGELRKGDLFKNHKEIWENKKNWCFPENFKLPDGLSTEEYYALLGDEHNGQEGAMGQGDMCTHDEWEEAAGDMGTKIKIEGILKEIEKAGGFGKLPGNLQQQIEISRQPPRINPKQLVKNFVQNVLGSSRTTTWKRQNRRFDNDEFPGHKREYIPSIVYAVDVSGSMSDQDVEEGVRIANAILDLGCELLLWQFDTEIKEERLTMRDRKKIKTFFVQGRGGTDFNDVFRKFRETRCRASGIVFFTDGSAGDITENVTAKTIAVITADGTKSVFQNKGIKTIQIGERI